tara:strand:+ start:1347 stop:1538 length:192 start_codon:yes stop_codon:yes gene_type:complete
MMRYEAPDAPPNFDDGYEAGLADAMAETEALLRELGQIARQTQLAASDIRGHIRLALARHGRI